MSRQHQYVIIPNVIKIMLPNKHFHICKTIFQRFIKLLFMKWKSCLWVNDVLMILNRDFSFSHIAKLNFIYFFCNNN